jgi:hypothetical protein
MKRGNDVVGSELNDEVHIHRETRVSVGTHSEAPSNQIPDFHRVERSDNRL